MDLLLPRLSTSVNYLIGYLAGECVTVAALTCICWGAGRPRCCCDCPRRFPERGAHELSAMYAVQVALGPQNRHVNAK